MIGHAEQCVQRWCDLTNRDVSSLRQVVTPALDDHLLPPQDTVEPGQLAPIAARIILKCLYIARIGRPDILFAVNVLARQVRTWTRACDKRLERLIAYIHNTTKFTQHCYVGNTPDQCQRGLFCDASFAAELNDSKSPTGAFLCLFGDATFVPITWMCKKQGAVSHSSSEAEIIAMDAALRADGLPALELWDAVQSILSSMAGNHHEANQSRHQNLGRLQVALPNNPWDSEASHTLSNIDYIPSSMAISERSAKLIVFEDNEAVLKMCVKGRVPTLRHVTRTHRVDLDWIIERLKTDSGISMKYVKTTEQMADMLTKANFVAPLWKSLLKLHQIGHHQPLNNPPQPEPMFFAMLSVACESGKNLTRIWM